VQTLGIDLATVPSRTGVCTVTWDGAGAVAAFPAELATDGALIAACSTADKVGIDCPFGWPDPFVAALVAHRDAQAWPGQGFPDGAAFRRRLAYRATDQHVLTKTHVWPLSVSANLIGMTAMRCAGLLDALAPIDRAGTGQVAEVYPAAALHLWHLWQPGYKTQDLKGREALGKMLDGLCTQMPTLRFGLGAEQRCRDSHDAFDALICALVARAAACGLTTPPQGEEQQRRAQTEGWIHLPTGGPHDLSRALAAP